MNNISDDVVAYMLTYLPVTSLYNTFTLSKHFNSVVDNECQWEQYLSVHFPTDNISSTMLTAKEKYRQLCSSHWCTNYQIDGVKYTNFEHDYFSLTNNRKTVTVVNKLKNVEYQFIHIDRVIPTSGTTSISFRPHMSRKEDDGYLSNHFILLGVVEESWLIDISSGHRNTYLGEFSNDRLNIGYANNGYLCRDVSGSFTTVYKLNDIITISIDADHNSGEAKFGMCSFYVNGTTVPVQYGNIFERDTKERLYFCMSIQPECRKLSVTITDYVHKPSK
jgi:hypothetical protein